MKFNLHKPCTDCPFRKDIAFFLPEARRQEIANSLRNDQVFQCHKTSSGEWDDDFNYYPTGDEIHCAGALIIMQKNGEIGANWPLRFAVGLGILNVDALDLGAPVFGTLDEFITGDPG